MYIIDKWSSVILQIELETIWLLCGYLYSFERFMYITKGEYPYSKDLAASK